MNNNTVSEFFKNQIDDSIPTWQELGTQALFAGLAGMLLAIGIYLVVAL